MNCERFQTVVNDLAREQIRDPQRGRAGSPAEQRGPRAGSARGVQDLGWGAIPAGVGVMDANERARALEHAAECDGCARNWEDERSLTAGLRALAGEMNSLAAPPLLEANVLAAFRERGNIRPAVRAVVRPFQAPRQMPRYWIAAIAALLLVVFGMVVVRSGVLSRSKPQVAKDEGPKAKTSSDLPPQVIEQPAPLTTVKVPIELPVPSPRRNPNYLAASYPSRVSKGKQTNAASNNANRAGDAGTSEGNSEIATDFFPIGYGTTPNLQEGGQLLRVELPRAAVARFGLPVNMDRTGERVKADVLVGADGLAQAIRFVH